MALGRDRRGDAGVNRAGVREELRYANDPQDKNSVEEAKDLPFAEPRLRAHRTHLAERDGRTNCKEHPCALQSTPKSRLPLDSELPSRKSMARLASSMQSAFPFRCAAHDRPASWCHARLHADLDGDLAHHAAARLVGMTLGVVQFDLARDPGERPLGSSSPRRSIDPGPKEMPTEQRRTRF